MKEKIDFSRHNTIQNSDEGINLIELFRVLRLNLIPILVVTFLGLVVSYFIAINSPDIYKSTALIRIMRQDAGFNIFGNQSDGLNFLQNNSQSIENELAIMEIYSMRKKVAEEIKDTLKYFDKRSLNLLVNKNPNEEISYKSIDQIAGTLAGATQIEQRANLQIVEISTESTSPIETAFISNTYATVYQKASLMNNRKQLSGVREFLNKQVDEKFKDLAEIEERINQYQQQGGIVSVDEQASNIINTLSSFEADQNSIRIDMVITNENLTYLKSELEKQEPMVSDYLASQNITQYISELQKRIATLKVNKDIASLNIETAQGEKAVKSYDNKISQFEELLNQKISQFKNSIYLSSDEDIREKVNQILNLEVKLNELKASYDVIQSIIDEYELKFSKLPKQIIEFARLQRERNVKEQLYLLVQEKYQQALVQEQSVPETVQFLERARIPSKPIKPNRIMIILIGTIMGAGLSIGFVIVKNLLDHTIKTPEDIQKMGYKVLGWIPKITEITKKESELEFITKNRPKSTHAEAFRALRTRLQLLKRDNKKVRSFVMTSGSPQEGKTFINVNTAASLAMSGKSTIIIDCDLRKPRIHKLFRELKTPGLTEYFSKENTLDEVIRESEIENLYYIPSGRIPANPSEVLGSVIMERLIEDLKSRFEYVVLDSPPIISVTDAEILSCLVDTSILVVRAEKTDKEILQKAVELLDHEDTFFSGIVLNDFTVRKEYGSYYKYYYYYYSTASDKVKRKLNVQINDKDDKDE